MKESTMKKTLVSLSLLALPVSYAAYAMDSFDAQLHSVVTQKVQQDHAADLKAGRIGHSTTSHVAGATTSAGPTTSDSITTSAAHPNQVQDLKRRKKKTPPPNTHGGPHHHF